ncbi:MULTISPECIES: ABC transporter substrate-binding protein [Actinomyces]|uniref:Sugar ABC transporter substrate-binding protein n=1 Tax=Actinomyces respiraculi TaxID=2744574 RepID=A0A7T0LJR6_9ACTO|nr:MULTISPECIES: sugar ABC transporter substrate-binding protein [Actinomyces]QPL04691.1 sugar ABC transporter substrate-binding protein [Actinomyces respiraculi]
MRNHTLPRRSLLLGGAVLSAATLSACSSPQGVGSGDPDTPAEAGGIEGERTGKELVFYLSAGHDYQPYLDVIADFEKEHSIKVTIQTFQWGDLQQKLTADFLSGQTPDLVEEGGSWWSTRWGADGNIMALDDFIAAEEGDFLSDFVESGLALRQDGGKTYGIPLHVTMGGLVFANKDMLDAAGVAMPTTWDEFKAAAKAIQGSGVEYGCALNNDSFYGRPWYLQNGVKWDAKSEEPIGPSDKLVEALTFQKDLIYTDALAPVPVASNEYSAPRKVFTTGRAGLIITGPWDINPIMTENPDFPLTIGMPLTGPGGSGTTIAGSGLMIPAKSQNAELAWKLITALTATEVQEKVTATVGMACSRKSWAESETVRSNPNLSVVAAAREVATVPDRAFWSSMNAAKLTEAEKVMYEDVILNGADPASTVATYYSTAAPLLQG